MVKSVALPLPSARRLLPKLGRVLINAHTPRFGNEINLIVHTPRFGNEINLIVMRI